MGSGLSFKCSKCGWEYGVHLGIGMGFPSVFGETVEDIRNGKYGEEWKILINSEQYIVPDAEEYLFYCKSCGTWETGPVPVRT